MEPLFVNAHEYSADELKTVIKLVTKFDTKKSAIMGLLFIIIGFLLFMLSKDITFAKYMSIIVITLGFVVILITVVMSILINKQYKSSVKSKLEFYDDKLIDNSETANNISKEIFEYDAFTKGIKLKEYTLLYVNKSKVVFIYNEGLTDAFFAFLKNKIKNFKD